MYNNRKLGIDKIKDKKISEKIYILQIDLMIFAFREKNLGAFRVYGNRKES